MRKSYERAVQLAPDKIEYRYALANAYASLGDFDNYLEQATVGRNLEQTSVGAHLLAAWQCILKSNWKGASDFLVKASRIDPDDSRIFAYMGAVAEGQHQVQEAAACFRAGLAVEETNGVLRATALGAGSPVCLFDEVGRAVALRIRLARMIEEQDTTTALALYEKNLDIEPRITSPEVIALFSHVESRSRSETEQLQLRNHPMLRTVIDAMLPEPSCTVEQQKIPPNAAGLLRTSRSLAAVALYKLGRKQEAAEYFCRTKGYENYARQYGVGSAYLTIIGIWTPRPVEQIAADCYREIGDTASPRRRGPSSSNNFPRRRP
ncbi:MAG: hypothetical protein CV087_15170 [Candidatus Brocadia sp. WS118]|nr:MAG: hypothetical protein CV087_15170 [Candidatus Brocadia sp. WS118]